MAKFIKNNRIRIILILIGMICLFWTYTEALELEILLRGGYFQPSDENFREIYGGGLAYGGELNLRVSSNWWLCVGLDYFSRTGQLTFTKERTELTIIPLGMGLAYFQSLHPAEVYLALGWHYFKYKESNPIGMAEKGSSGVTLEPGILLVVFRGLRLRVFFRYSYYRLQPADYRINIGGLQPGLALGYRF